MINSEDSSQHMLPISSASPGGGIKKECHESPFPPSSPHTHALEHGHNTQLNHHILCSPSVTHHENMGTQASEMIYSNPGAYPSGPSRYSHPTEDVVMSTETGQRHGHLPGDEYHPSLARRISSYESCSSPDSPDRHFCSSTTQSNGDLNNSIAEV